MYSQESVFTRFASHRPYRHNSTRLIAVKYEGGQWYYDDNAALRAFTPQSTDVLIAEVDFTNDTITGLEGMTGDHMGIEKGFATGDLEFSADRWGDAPNDGEFKVEGTFFVRNPRVSVGDTGNGVAAQDDATGTGYIMYSQESVLTRFATHRPHRHNSGHLIAVKYEGGQWYYDDNAALRAFTPRDTDVLLAEVDFQWDSILSLEGTAGELYGIRRGFLTGDLTFFADRWGAKANDGEFRIDGSFFIA